MKILLVSTVVAGALTMPLVASANIPQQTTTGQVPVTYNLQELSTEKGRAEFERRVRRAADQICGSRFVREAGSVAQSRHNRDCYNDAVARALNAVSSNTGNTKVKSAS